MNLKKALAALCAQFLIVMNGWSLNPELTIKDSVLLSEVEIISSRLVYSLNDDRIVQPDTSFLQRSSYHSLQNLFTAQGGFHIRTSGPGLLSTSSIRGGAAVHTDVIWNGFSLVSPMNGLTDLSLLPVSFFEQIEVVQGSNHAIAGVGGLGGSIFMHNSKPKHEGLTTAAGLNYGSFGLINPNLALAYNYGRGSIVVRGFYRQAENRYPYPDPNSPDNEKRKLDNAASKQGGFLTEKYLQAGQHQFAVRFWYQKANREIPHTIFQQSAETVQYDEVIRPQLEWKWALQSNLELKYTASASDESNRYVDPQAEIDALNESFTTVHQLSLSWLLRENQKFIFNTDYHYQQAKSKNYGSLAIRNLVSLHGLYQIQFWEKRLAFSLSGRAEHATDQTFLPSAAFGMHLRIIDPVSLHYHLNYNNRLPSFNDLFWEPGGNQELLPEKAVSNELGLLFDFFQHHQKHDLTFKPVVYYRDMKNYIQWKPGSGGYWSGHNAGDVVSRGFELNLNYTFRLSSNHAVIAGGNFSLSRTYQKESQDKKQLIHIPVQAGAAFIAFKHTDYFIGIEWNHTGKRYTTTDNSAFSTPYNTFDMSLQYAPFKAKHGLNLFGRLNNIFNVYYENIASRPMPGFNFEAGFTYFFNSKH